MKKIFGMLLTLMLLLTGIAFADSQRQSGNFTYELLNDGTVRILKYTGNFDKDIHIPTFIDGYEVTVIGEEAFSCEDRDFPFGHEDVIVTLPDSITTLEEKAFYHGRVKQINIPANVKVIKPGALRMASSVTYNLSKGNSKYALIDGNLYDKQKKEFLSWCGAEKVTIPNGIKSIAPYAFSYGLDNHPSIFSAEGRCSIVIPDSVNLIGDYAFNNVSLKNPQSGEPLHFSGVKSIGKGAFYKTYFFDGFILPHSVTTIPEYAFAHIDMEYSDSYNDNIVLHDQVESIDAYAFYGAKCFMRFETDEKKVSYLTRLPAQLEEIGENAFKDSDQIFDTCITLNENLISVGDGAFQTHMDNNDYDLKSIVLPSELYGLGDNVFNEDVTLIVEEGSYAETYARNEGYTYIYSNPVEDDLSWLTE